MRLDIFPDGFRTYVTGSTDVVTPTPEPTAPEMLSLEKGYDKEYLVGCNALDYPHDFCWCYHGKSEKENIHMFGHSFYLKKGISVIDADFFDRLPNYFFDLTSYKVMALAKIWPQKPPSGRTAFIPDPPNGGCPRGRGF